MEVLINESPAKYFDIVGIDMLYDPRHEALADLCFPAALRCGQSERPSDFKLEDYYHDAIASDWKVPEHIWTRNNGFWKLQDAALKAGPFNAEQDTSDTGFIYLLSSVAELRRCPSSMAILLRLRYTNLPHHHLDMVIYPRAVGYAMDMDGEALLAEVAWLIASPTINPGELDIPDYLTDQNLDYIHYHGPV